MIGGAGVVRGYLNRPDLTAERFLPDKFESDPSARMYRTGALVKWSGDGRVLFVGRIDHQLKIRGYRIELGEIEAVMLEQTGVREAVVIAREDTPGDKRLVGYMTAVPGASISTAEIRARLRERLPEYLVPSQLVAIPAMPLTPNAKIDRKALPAPETIEQDRPVTFVGARTELEQTIAAVWMGLLHVETVGVEDNFFDLGGHSLMTVQAHRKLRELTSREISITDLFRFPTIRTLAGYLDGQEGETEMAQTVARVETRKESVSRRQQLRNRRKGQDAAV